MNVEATMTVPLTCQTHNVYDDKHLQNKRTTVQSSSFCDTACNLFIYHITTVTQRIS